MKRKSKIRLAIIVPVLVLFSIAVWYGINMLVARQLSLIRLVEVGDVEGVEYVCRWDRQQLNTHGLSQGLRFRPQLIQAETCTTPSVTSDGLLARDWTHRCRRCLTYLMPYSHVLMVAAGTDDLVIARLLLEAGADPAVFKAKHARLSPEMELLVSQCELRQNSD